jgi:hypothetical protein
MARNYVFVWKIGRWNGRSTIDQVITNRFLGIMRIYYDRNRVGLDFKPLYAILYLNKCLPKWIAEEIIIHKNGSLFDVKDGEWEGHPFDPVSQVTMIYQLQDYLYDKDKEEFEAEVRLAYSERNQT